jgi:RNA polymerase sigma-70 factor (ECF subfamily)
MEDRDIVNLYWERNTNAIKETATKYGVYCKTIAKNILGNNEDAEECVNDTYLNTWNSIPPNRPNVLSAYLGKITRNLSFDRFRNRHADKRGGGEIELVLDELGECVSGADSVEQEVEKKELVRAINSFLDTLSQEKCNIFLCRYWYAIPVSEIATRFGMSEGNVSVTLTRIRSKLKNYLKERGYDL